MPAWRCRPVAEAASKRSGLGLGLAAIIPTAGRDQAGGLRDIPLELIRPNPDQPRRHFDEPALLALADSIRARRVPPPGGGPPATGAPCSSARTTLGAGAWRAPPATAAGRCARPSAARARPRTARPAGASPAAATRS